MTEIALSKDKALSFAKSIIHWQKLYGRHNLPWQVNPTPYRIWVSEIMLQQTQATTVIPYFERFMDSFPNLKALASAPIDSVLHHWSGLGYYARARNLHKTAQVLIKEHQGKFPATPDELVQLAGIGQSTAGAICSFSLNTRGVILDGNVKRVLCRFFGISGWPGASEQRKLLWTVSDQLTPQKSHASYNQGMMDLGASCCTRTKPDCVKCPLLDECYAFNNKKVKQLPTPKPKLSRPVKEKLFLVLTKKPNQVLLLKRPPTGLWGGLWSFPEFDCIEDLHAFCKNHVLTPGKKGTFGKSLLHQFTHYTLSARPYYINGDYRLTSSTDSDSQVLWYDSTTPQKVGISTLVMKLLIHSTTDKKARNNEQADILQKI